MYDPPLFIQSITWPHVATWDYCSMQINGTYRNVVRFRIAVLVLQGQYLGTAAVKLA